MGRRLPAAFAGRRRSSIAAAADTADGQVKKPTVPVAQLRALGLRPNWQQAANYPQMGEDEPRIGLLAQVRKAIKQRPPLGFFHTGIAIGSATGYPDLHIWGPRGMIWRELKGSDGVLYVRQLEVLDELRAAGADVGLWWPEDWHLAIIDQELDRLVGVEPPPPRVFRPGFRFCGCPADADHVCPQYRR